MSHYKMKNFVFLNMVCYILTHILFWWLSSVALLNVASTHLSAHLSILNIFRDLFLKTIHLKCIRAPDKLIFLSKITSRRRVRIHGLASHIDYDDQTISDDFFIMAENIRGLTCIKTVERFFWFSKLPFSIGVNSEEEDVLFQFVRDVCNICINEPCKGIFCKCYKFLKGKWGNNNLVAVLPFKTGYITVFR